MDSQQVAVDGVAGEVTLTTALVSRPEVAVNGVTVAPHDGFYDLPGPDGTLVRATMPVLGFLHPYPGLKVEGRTYRAARVPRHMWLVIVLPLLLILAGVVPGVFGIAGAWLNIHVMRSSGESVVKLGAMGVILLVCAMGAALVGVLAQRLSGTY